MTKEKGRVVSTKMKDTVVVALERRIRHPLYQKVITRTHRVLAHDPGNRSHEGDWVSIVPARPFSKRKCYQVMYDSSPN